MRTYSKILSLLFVLTSGCAVTNNYEQMVAQWRGISEVELIRAWGIPKSQYVVDGIKFITYERTKNDVEMLPSYSTYFSESFGSHNHSSSNSISVYGSSSYPVTKVCKTTFEIRNGRVSSWSWEGNGCVAFLNSETGQYYMP